jgi:hypothetical protein
MARGCLRCDRVRVVLDTGLVKRFDPIPLIQPSGHQPYAPAGGQMPGPALLAMLRGADFSGNNPVDPWRALQAAAGKRQPHGSLLR